MMEGYAYGSAAGQVFQIAENTEVLKYKMYKGEIPYDVLAPKQVKKYFTGSGNSNKGMMFLSFKNIAHMIFMLLLVIHLSLMKLVIRFQIWLTHMLYGV